MKTAKIEIVIDLNGEVKYNSNLPPAITVFYLEFVKTDLLARSMLQSQEKKSIVVPKIVPSMGGPQG